jgi:hypothetical protein
VTNFIKKKEQSQQNRGKCTTFLRAFTYWFDSVGRFIAKTRKYKCEAARKKKKLQ